MKTESFKILHIFKPTEKLVGGNHTMNTTCSLQLVRATCQLMFAIAVLCVLTRTCTHMCVRFVHADPGEALRRRGRRGPRKAAAVRQVTEFVRTRPCQARPGLWPEDVAVLQAACQALRSCAGGGRVDAAPGPSRRGTAPSMPVRTAARPGPPTRECVGEWGGRPPSGCTGTSLGSDPGLIQHEGPAALTAGTARRPAGRRRTSRGSAPRLPAGLWPAASFPPSDGPAWQAVPAQVRDCLSTLVAVPRVSSRALSRPTPRTWAPPFSVPRLGHFGGLDSLPTAGLWKAGPVALCRAPCSESFCFALSSGLAGTPAAAVWPFPSEARSSW